MKGNKYWLLLACLCLLLWVTGANAQPDQGERERVRAERERALDESRHALEAARSELREAVRRVAELRRAQVVRHVDGEDDFHFSFTTHDDRPRLGLVMGQSEKSPGVRVLSVTPESPAEEAGIQSGDRIVAIDGAVLNADEPELRLRDFFNTLGELDEGRAVSLRYFNKANEEKTVSIIPRKLEQVAFIPPIPSIDIETIVEGVSESLPMMGELGENSRMFVRLHRQQRLWRDLELLSLDAQLGEYFGRNAGLLIVGVPEALSDELQRGDVLLGINGREPKDVNHAFRILRSYEPGETVSIDVLRHGGEYEVSIEIPQPDERDGGLSMVMPPMPVAAPKAPRAPRQVRIKGHRHADI